VISADCRRAAGAEELAAFTRILGLDLILADTPEEVARSVAPHLGHRPVLIDASGCNPFDAAERQMLSTLAHASNAVMAQVLPAGLDVTESAELAAVLAKAGASLLVVTRMDVARRLGGVLAAAAVGPALVEAGIGPGVADGMVPMTPELLAERLLKVPSGEGVSRPPAKA
jgi:flagellar biosynthesis protein FlhF